MKRVRDLLVLGGLAIFALSGCSKKAAPTAPQTSQPAGPAPNSTTNALNGVAWSMNHLQWRPIADLLPEDFQFVFAAADSAGNAFTGHALDRDQILLSLQHLLETGTATEPPASSVNLILDRTFVPIPDSRPGKAYPWHQEILSTFTLSISAGDHLYRIVDRVAFFLVRGDSASIPPDLAAQGFKPDPNRWWIERVGDSGVGGSLLNRVTGTLPGRSVTWGSILALYYPAGTL